MLKPGLIALMLLALTACASDPLRQSNLNVRESYRVPGFTEEYSSEAIGLLAASDGENSFEYRKLLGEFVEEAVKRERPDLKVIPYWRSLGVINTKGFTTDYADMLKAYSSTGILDRDRLKKIGVAVGVRYFLQPRLVSFSQRQSTRFSAFGLTIFKTHESEIKIYIEMWDAVTGDLIWVGVAETNMASEKFMSRPIPFEEVAKFAIENLVKKMP